MSVQAYPRKSFEVIETEFFLQLLMSLFAYPASFDGARQLFDRHVGRKVREIVLALAS